MPVGRPCAGVPRALRARQLVDSCDGSVSFAGAVIVLHFVDEETEALTVTAHEL